MGTRRTSKFIRENAKYVENREKYLKSYNFGCNSSTDMIYITQIIDLYVNK